MAVTGSGRGPIRVGSGYIDVFPKLNQKQLRETRAQLEKQMGASGKKAGKTFSDGVTSQVAQIPKKAKAAADKAQKEIQKSSQNSKKVLQRIEQEITRQYGKEAGKRFKEAAELEKKKQRLLDGTTAATRRAIQTTVREEQQAARTASRTWETAERERLRLLRDRERAERQAHREEARRWEVAQRSYQKFLRDRQTAAARAAREEAAAHRRAHQQMREDTRRTLMEARAARLADLRNQMDTHRDQLASLRSQLQGYRRQMQDHTRSVGRGLTTLQTGWRRQGEHIERLGTNITETGRLVTTNLLGPLGAVSAMITTIGVKSADMRILGQMGLSAAGVSTKTSAKEMRNIQQYAIDTPFSIDTMHEYQMKLIRSIAGNDDSWYKPATKGAAADRAAGKTSDIIMAVGDTMARAGNLDPEMFKRAMYAVDRIMDLDKAPTRNINQLVTATGIPAGELARMFGFKDSGEFWKQVGTPVAKGGGISGTDMVDNLLEGWDPKYFQTDSKGERKIDPKTGQPMVNADSTREGGSAGFGERMTSATISGRISQMKEQAQFNLGSLFVNEDAEGRVRYTGLGESLMGRAVGEDKEGNIQYEGGLLQQIQELGSEQKGNIVTLLTTFFDAIGTFVEQIQWFSDWLNAHPQVKEVFANLLKMAAAALPFILALGLMTKTFGKVNKILAAALGPLGGLFSGLQGATRVGRQVAAGRQSRREGGSFREGYRNRRTELREGDERGIGRRTRDRITGRDSNSDDLRRQMRQTEDSIRQTEDGIRDLQRSIRDVNSTSIRQLVDRFAGSSGNGSLDGAAQNARDEITGINSQVGELNRSSLSTVNGQVGELQNKARDLLQELRNINSEVDKLNKQSLTSFKTTVDSAEGSVNDLDDRLKNAGVSVGNLNRRKLDSLREELSSTTSAANRLEDKVQDAARAVSNLNDEKLSQLRGEFRTLNTSVNNVYKSVGTTKSGLSGRVTNLNNRNLNKVTKEVNQLKDALDEAAKKANELNTGIGNVNSASSLGGGGGGGTNKKGGGKKSASGGMVTAMDAQRYGTLPGYAPGVDTIPAVLSPGEAVLRPEVAKALGPGLIDSWNAAAMRGEVKGYARGTSRASIQDRLSMTEVGNLFNSSVGFVGSGNRVDNRAGTNTRPWGARQGGGNAGLGASNKFRSTLGYFTEELPEMFRKRPSGWGQLAGIVAGAIWPNVGKYFWEDIWKGQGNILDRGQTFLGHLWDPENIWEIIKDLGSNTWDTIKDLGSIAGDLLSDPIGTIKEQISGMVEDVSQSFEGFKSQIATMRDIMNNPGEHAQEVRDEFMAQARNAMPNTEGLFNFANGGIVPGYSPDDDRVRALLSPGEAVLRPEAARALGVSNIMALNKAAKDGTLPTKDTSKVIIPAPDAEAFKTAVEGIEGSLSDGRSAIESTRDLASKAWADTGAKVKSSVDSTVRPAIKRQATDQRQLASSTKSDMSSVLTSVSSAASGTSKSFGDMRDGLRTLERSFGNAQRNIDSSMDLIPTAVKSNVREAVSFIQKSMIAPINSKLLGPAKLAKIGSLPQYAEGGVVPGYAPGTDSVLAMLSPGESILRPEVTRALGENTVHALNQAAMQGRLPAFASGGVVGKWGDVIPGMFSDTAGPILKNLVEAFMKGSGSWPGRIGGVGVKYSGTAIEKILEGKDKSFMETMMSPVGDMVKRWTPLVQRVLKELGLSLKHTSLILHRIRVESGGNPNAINLWDTNAMAGYPSQGLMQTIPGTFNAYAGPYKGLGITNPLASIYAGINYATSRYGNNWTRALSGTQGYWTGTLSASPGLKLVGEKGPELVNFKGGERVYNNGDTSDMLSGGRPIAVTVNEAKTELTSQAILRGFQFIDTMYGNRI